MSAVAVSAPRGRVDSKVGDVNEDEMRYQRICKAIGEAPASNSKYLTQIQRTQAHNLIQAELGAMACSGIVNMEARKRTLEAYLKTKFHADDAHYMVAGVLRVEEGNVRRNLAMRGLITCDGLVVCLADRVTSVIRAVWKRTKQALPSYLHLPNEEVTEKVTGMLSPTQAADDDRPFVPHLTLEIEKDGKDVEQINNRGCTPIDRNQPLSPVGQLTPISTDFHGALITHTRNGSSIPVVYSAPESVQSPHPLRRPPRQRQHRSMTDIGIRADGTSRAAALVRSETAVGAQALSCCARVQRSCCFGVLRGLWNLVPERARNHIVKDFIKDPLKEGVRDAARVAVVYGVISLFRMIIG